MIEIKLTEEDAQKYLDGNDEHTEELIALRKYKVDAEKVIKSADGFIKSLEKQLEQALSCEAPVSAKVLADTIKVKDIEKGKPPFANPKEPEPTGFVTGTWNTHEVALIKSRMCLNSTNKDRSLEIIAKALNRTEASLRDKLTKMGIKIKKGMCYYKD